jgi:hypothetical protein
LQDQNGKLNLDELDWLWCFYTASCALARAPLLQKEADLMLLGREIDAMDPNDKHDAAKLARCVGEQKRATAAIDD